MYTFIVNSKISSLKSVCRAIEQAFSGHEIKYTEYAGHALELAAQIIGIEHTVIAVGGDGTVNEVLNGIMKTPRQKRPSMAIYPAGSANDFAIAQGLSRNVSPRVGQKETEIRPVDVGLIEGPGIFKYFLNIADAGFGAEVVKSLTTKKFLGPSFSYFRAITFTFFNYRPVVMEINGANFSWIGKAYGVFVANSSQLGSGIKIDLNAKIDDGVFTAFVVGELTGMEYLLEVNRLKRGKAPKSKKIQSFQCTALSIHSESACSIEADGELMGQLPVQITAKPGAIRLLYL